MRIFIIKHHFAFFLFMCFCHLTQAQSDDINAVLIRKEAKLDKFHTYDELNKLNKSELVKLYKERLKVLIYLLPYNALSNKPGATLEDTGIPSSADNKNLIGKEYKNSEDFYKSIDVSLDNFIAYADKNNIIWSILFYEETVRKIMLGRDF